MDKIIQQGPIFEHEPGWSVWFKRNFTTIILPLLIILVVILIIYLSSKGEVKLSDDEANALQPNQEEMADQRIEETVLPGDSYTTVSRRAIARTVSDLSLPITPGQRLYGETILQGEIRDQLLKPGGIILLERNDIIQILNGYDDILERQRTKWETNATRIEF